MIQYEQPAQIGGRHLHRYCRLDLPDAQGRTESHGGAAERLVNKHGEEFLKKIESDGMGTAGNEV